MSKRKRYIESCEVSEVKTYELGGYPQKVLFEGKRTNAPIVIYLHGGPGSPIPFCVGSRGLFPEITDRFIMVYWDQLGCGINDCMIDDDFAIEDYVFMTVDLIRLVHRDYPDNQINLLGVSWGSILAAESAIRVPELLHRVAVYGQVTKDLFFNDEVFSTLKAARLSSKETLKLDQLEKAGEIGQQEIKDMAGLIRKHTQGYQNKSGGNTPIGRILFGLLTSPDYTLKDVKAAVVNGMLKNQSLHSQLIALDLRETPSQIKIPYLIMQGDTDIVTSTAYIESFVRDSGNGSLHFRVIENSGHIPGGASMERMIDEALAFLSEK